MCHTKVELRLDVMYFLKKKIQGPDFQFPQFDYPRCEDDPPAVVFPAGVDPGKFLEEQLRRIRSRGVGPKRITPAMLTGQAGEEEVRCPIGRNNLFFCLECVRSNTVDIFLQVVNFA